MAHEAKNFDHLLGKLSGRNLPEREEWFQSRTFKLLFAVGADVLKKKIAKGDSFYSLGNCLVANGFHGTLVVRIGAWPRQRHGDERNACGPGLHFHQRVCTSRCP